MYPIALSLGILFAELYPILLYLNYATNYYQDPDDDLSSITASEYKIQRDTKKINRVVGLLGVILVGYKGIYAYIIGAFFGGHRSWASHKWPFSTIGRMLFYNFGLFWVLHAVYGYLDSFLGWEDTNIWYEFYMDIWLIPYLITQFISWSWGDIIHITLDRPEAKGILYIPKPDTRRKQYGSMAGKTNSKIRRNKVRESSSSYRREGVRGIIHHSPKKVAQRGLKVRPIREIFKHCFDRWRGKSIVSYFSSLWRRVNNFMGVERNKGKRRE